MTAPASAAPSQTELVETARHALAERHRSVDGYASEVLDRDDVWVVWFHPRGGGILEVGVAVVISKKTGAVEGITEDA
jgi:hypothetical protein